MSGPRGGHWILGLYSREDVIRRPRWGERPPRDALYITSVQGDGRAEPYQYRQHAVRFASLAAAQEEARAWRLYGAWHVYVLRVRRGGGRG